jgi:hypothetical protein
MELGARNARYFLNNREASMRLLSRIVGHAELAFDVIWGCIAVGIIAVAIGFATLGYESNDRTVVASNARLPPINVEAVRK